MTHLLARTAGIYAQIYLAAPIPLNIPMIKVPRTMRRDRAAETMLFEPRDSGNGIIARRKR